jgi:hypothetical protein
MLLTTCNGPGVYVYYCLCLLWSRGSAGSLWIYLGTQGLRKSKTARAARNMPRLLGPICDSMRMLLASPHNVQQYYRTLYSYYQLRRARALIPCTWCLPAWAAGCLPRSPGFIINIVLFPSSPSSPSVCGDLQYYHSGLTACSISRDERVSAAALARQLPVMVTCDITHLGNSSSIVTDSLHSPPGPFMTGCVPSSQRASSAWLMPISGSKFLVGGGGNSAAPQFAARLEFLWTFYHQGQLGARQPRVRASVTHSSLPGNVTCCNSSQHP